MAKKTPFRAALIQGKVSDVEVGIGWQGLPKVHETWLKSLLSASREKTSK